MTGKGMHASHALLEPTLGDCLFRGASSVEFECSEAIP
jgi:hypothetical protein